MSVLIRIAFLVTFMSALGGKVLAQGDFEGGFDAEDYDGVEDDQYQYWPVQLHPWKRAGFWAPHPSDYNPMRRPGSAGQAPRSSSKKSSDNPYHPVPRTVSQNQMNMNLRNVKSATEDLEGALDDIRDRDKRQSPGSFLLMKLGRLSTPKTVGNPTNRRVDRRRRL